jgi:hypothetical protein
MLGQLLELRPDAAKELKLFHTVLCESINLRGGMCRRDYGTNVIPNRFRNSAKSFEFV